MTARGEMMQQPCLNTRRKVKVREAAESQYIALLCPFSCKKMGNLFKELRTHERLLSPVRVEHASETQIIL